MVYLNKMDAVDDPDIKELVEMEIRELLNQHGFDGKETVIVPGSALAALNGEDTELGRKSIIALMKAVDESIPTPVRELDKDFSMPVESVYSIQGRGTVVTGKIEQGTVKIGDEIEVVGLRAPIKTTCTGVEMFKKLMPRGEAGDNVGILLRGIKHTDVSRGQILAKPGTVKSYVNLECELYALTKEEGGRHTPFGNNYQPQFFFRTANVTGNVSIMGDKGKMVMPGDTTKILVKLDKPTPVTSGLRFSIREGGKTVGAGVITRILADNDPLLKAAAGKDDKPADDKKPADKKADDKKAPAKPAAAAAPKAAPKK